MMPISFDMQEIAEAKASDDKLQQLKQFTSLKLQKFTLSETAFMTLQKKRPYIPGSLQRRVFDLDQMSHPSGRLSANCTKICVAFHG